MPSKIEHLDIGMIQPRLRELASWDEHQMALRLQQLCIIPSLKNGVLRQADSDKIAAEAFQKQVLRPLIYAYSSLGELAEYEDSQKVNTPPGEAKILADKIIDTLAMMMAGIHRNESSNKNNMVQNLIENTRKNLNADNELFLSQFGEIIPRIEKKAAEYRAQFERTMMNPSPQPELLPKNEAETDQNTRANEVIRQTVKTLDSMKPSTKEEREIHEEVTEGLTDRGIICNPRSAKQFINTVKVQLDKMGPTAFLEGFKNVLLELRKQLALIFAKIISFIADKEELKQKGDLIITGDVGKEASIVVNDGNLTIKGQIGAKTQIRMDQSTHDRASLEIEGNVGQGVIIQTQQTDITLKGTVSPDCQIQAQNGIVVAEGLNLGGKAGGGLRLAGKIKINAPKGRVTISSGDVFTDAQKDEDSPSLRK